MIVSAGISELMGTHVLAGLAVALGALAMLLIKQLFEKQAQLDAVRSQLEQAHRRLAEWEQLWQEAERSARTTASSSSSSSSRRPDEWLTEARRLADLEYIEQTPARLADLQQEVRRLRQKTRDTGHGTRDTDERSWAGGYETRS